MMAKRPLPKKLLVAIAMVLSFVLPNPPVAFATPSAWAEETVSEALALRFVPDTVSHDYQDNISRIDFCSIALNFLGFQYGFYTNNAQEADFPFHLYCTYHLDQNGEPYSVSDYTNPYDSWQGVLLSTTLFDDFPQYDRTAEYTEDELFVVTNHPRIATQAAIIGVMQGRGQRIFDPYSPITRQEAAVVLARVYAAYDGQIPANVPSADFIDQDSIASWATDAVSLMCAMDVMQGTEDGRFDPLAPYTVEQCIAAFYRLYQNAPTSRCRNNVFPLRNVETTFAHSNPGSWSNYDILFQCTSVNYSVFVGKAQIVAGREVNPNFIAVINNAGGIYWVDAPPFGDITDFNWSEESQQLTIQGVVGNRLVEWTFDIYAATHVVQKDGVEE